MNGLWQDVWFGVRLHLKSPGLLTVALLALALGIGANSAVFSVVYGVLLKPLPYPEPDRLMLVYGTQPACPTCPASYPKYIDWRNENRVFDVIGGSAPGSAVLTGQGDPQTVATTRTTASLFHVLAVQPAMGRWFREEEDHPSGPPVAILSHGFWERRLGADPHIIGRTLTLDGVARTVVGVMPRDFSHRQAEVWIPLARAVDERQRNSHFLTVYGRLKGNVEYVRARAEMHALGRRLAREHDNMGHGIDIKPYQAEITNDAITPLVVLLSAVSFVLLIACANVANLLLARAATRRREIALRAAIGATRWRMARQLLVESLLLSIPGGAIGLGLAYAGVRLFVAYAPPVLPRMSTIGVDPTVLLFTAAIAMTTGIVFGLAPILNARGTPASEALREETGRSGGTMLSRLSGNALVVAEIALAVVLLVGAGLMVRSLVRLQAQDLGISAERVVTAEISLPNARYGTPESRRVFFKNLLARLQTVPGVHAAGAISLLPLASFGNNSYFDVEGKSLWPRNKGPLVETRTVAGHYYQAMGVRLVKGRLLDERDGESSPHVIVINEAMARRCWPGEDPIGKRITFEGNDVWEVVGVVGDVRGNTPGEAAAIEAAASLDQVTASRMVLVVQSAADDPAGLVGGIRRTLADIDPQQPLANVQLMSDVVHEATAFPRLLSVLISSFASLAGLLAAIGIYGLMSYAVSQRRREFGIRLAMGASRGALHRLVLRRGVVLAAVGIATGSLAAAALTRWVGALLYQVTPGDPLVFAATCVGIIATALIASYLPARAAASVDPMNTFR